MALIAELKNQELAISKNTEFITTALSGKAANKTFAGFTFTEDGRQVTGCPMGRMQGQGAEEKLCSPCVNQNGRTDTVSG